MIEARAQGVLHVRVGESSGAIMMILVMPRLLAIPENTVLGAVKYSMCS